MKELTNNESAWLDTIQKDFTKEEWTERERHVATIKNWREATTAAARALVQVKEKKLDRHYKSWKEFCERECGITTQWANQLIIYAKILTGLTLESKPGHIPVKPILELKNYPEEQHDKIVKEAKRVHSKDGKTLTVKAIREAATQIEKAIDLDGTPIPEGDASYHWRRKPEGDELVKQIHAIGVAIKKIDRNDVMYLECDVPNTVKALRAAYHMFKGGLPAYVCRKCKGKTPMNCTLCHGRGMTGTWERKQNKGGKEFMEELQIRTF